MNCIPKMWPSYTEIETLSTNLMWMRIAYLENHEYKTEAQMRGLVAKSDAAIPLHLAQADCTDQWAGGLQRQCNSHGTRNHQRLCQLRIEKKRYVCASYEIFTPNCC